MPLGYLSNPKHPLWGFLKFALVFAGVMVAATFVMWNNASNFDETEFRALKELALILLAGGGVKGAASAVWGRKD